MKTKKNAAKKKRTRRSRTGVWLSLTWKPKDLGGYYPEERAEIKREQRFLKTLGTSDLLVVKRRKQDRLHTGTVMVRLLLEPVVIG